MTQGVLFFLYHSKLQVLIIADPVFAAVGVEPLGQVLGCLDQEELSIVVLDAGSQLAELARDAFEQINDEPFVFDVVAEFRAAAQVSRDAPCRPKTQNTSLNIALKNILTHKSAIDMDRF